MRRRELITLVGVALAAWPRVAAAQSPSNRALIAMLVSGSSDGFLSYVQAFRLGLHKLGYIEGQHVEIVYRYADGDPARLPALAAELVKLKPDVIVTTSTSAALAAKQATTTTPIISALLTDPVGSGLAVSEARPGGNVTGIEFTLKGLAGKQLELARDITPETSNVALLVQMKSASNPPQRSDAEATAKTLGIKLVTANIDRPDQIDSAFQAFAREHVDWVIVLGSSLFLNEGRRISSLAISLRLPTIFPVHEYATLGGLIGYGVEVAANHERAAYYVDRVLKGAKAGDLPIEFPTKLALTINLKTAKAIGLQIPDKLLLLADEVIE